MYNKKLPHIFLPYIGDIILYRGLKFEHVETITVYQTEKNFTYFYVNKYIFPNAKTLYYNGYVGDIIYETGIHKFDIIVPNTYWYKNYFEKTEKFDKEVIFMDENLFNEKSLINKYAGNNEELSREFRNLYYDVNFKY
jgi:hypothetical protein